MRNDQEQFAPLGPAIPKPAPEPAPEWRPSGGTPGFEINAQGQLRHVPPKPPPVALPGPYLGTPQTWGRAIEALRRECWRSTSPRPNSGTTPE